MHPDVRAAEHVKKRLFGKSQGDHSQDETAHPDGQDPETDPRFPPLGLKGERDGLEALHADADQGEQLDATAQGVGKLLQGAHRHWHPAQKGEEQQRCVHRALQEITGGQVDQQGVIEGPQALCPEHNPTHPQVPGQTQD